VSAGFTLKVRRFCVYNLATRGKANTGTLFGRVLGGRLTIGFLRMNREGLYSSVVLIGGKD